MSVARRADAGSLLASGWDGGAIAAPRDSPQTVRIRISLAATSRERPLAA